MKSYYTRYDEKTFLKTITQVVNDLGYFPSETEYRKYRKGKKLPMPKVSKSVTNLSWPEFGQKYFSYLPMADKNVEVFCAECNKKFHKKLNQINKTNNNFCSQSCAAIYNNAHKKHGTRRSKLEKYLEEELTKLYPNLEIHFNRKDAINSELDIYIPSLSLAFELNGIFHYEPIYGQDKLASIQNNDNRKFQACLENNIELCIIDTSSQKRFTEKSSNKFLSIITNVIKQKQGE